MSEKQACTPQAGYEAEAPRHRRCPFCGGSELLFTSVKGDPNSYCLIVCDKCGASGPTVDAEQESTDAYVWGQWNRREGGQVDAELIRAATNLAKAAEAVLKRENASARQIGRLKAALFYIVANHTDSHLSPLGSLCEAVAYDLPTTGDVRFDEAFGHFAPASAALITDEDRRNPSPEPPKD